MRTHHLHLLPDKVSMTLKSWAHDDRFWGIVGLLILAAMIIAMMFIVNPETSGEIPYPRTFYPY